MFQRGNFAIMCMTFSLKSKNLSHLSYSHAYMSPMLQAKMQVCGALVRPNSSAPGWGDAPPQDFLSCTWLEIDSWFIRGCYFSLF